MTNKASEKDKRYYDRGYAAGAAEVEFLQKEVQRARAALMDFESMKRINQQRSIESAKLLAEAQVRQQRLAEIEAAVARLGAAVTSVDAWHAERRAGGDCPAIATPRLECCIEVWLTAGHSLKLSQPSEAEPGEPGPARQHREAGRQDEATEQLEQRAAHHQAP